MSKELEWLYYMEGVCKEFLSRKDEYMQLTFTTEQVVEALKEIDTIKQLLSKSQDIKDTRFFGKDLINLNVTLKQSTDKPIFYVGSCGNKYIVPQKLYEEQVKTLSLISEDTLKERHAAQKQKKVIDIIKKKCSSGNSNLWLVTCVPDYKTYMAYINDTSNHDHDLVRAEHNILTEIEFNLLRRYMTYEEVK